MRRHILRWLFHSSAGLNYHTSNFLIQFSHQMSGGNFCFFKQSRKDIKFQRKLTRCMGGRDHSGGAKIVRKGRINRVQKRSESSRSSVLIKRLSKLNDQHKLFGEPCPSCWCPANVLVCTESISKDSDRPRVWNMLPDVQVRHHLPDQPEAGSPKTQQSLHNSAIRNDVNQALIRTQTSEHLTVRAMRQDLRTVEFSYHLHFKFHKLSFQCMYWSYSAHVTCLEANFTHKKVPHQHHWR